MCRSKGQFRVQWERSALFLFTSASEMQSCLLQLVHELIHGVKARYLLRATHLNQEKFHQGWASEHRGIRIKNKTQPRTNSLSLSLCPPPLVSFSSQSSVPSRVTLPTYLHLPGSQRISDSEISDYDCEDGVGVITGTNTHKHRW